MEGFDLICGTSAGALIGAALAAGRSAESISKLFMKRSHEIFPPLSTWRRMTHYYTPWFSQKPLARVIDEMIGLKTEFKDLEGALAIPVLNESKGRAEVFSSFDKDKASTRVSDVILASSAAPMYFPAHNIGGDRYFDGGLFANAPDQIAIDCFRRRWDSISYDDIMILSIGTTNASADSPRPTCDTGHWGIKRWLINPRGRIIKLMLRTQTDHIVDRMYDMPLAGYVRIDDRLAESDQFLEMDNAEPRALLRLVELARARMTGPDTWLSDLRRLVSRRRW